MTEDVFSEAATPRREIERIAALQRYEIMDSPSESIFDGLLEIAAQVFQTPVLLLSFIDAERIFVKSAIGIDPIQVSRTDSLLSHIIQQGEVLVRPEANFGEVHGLRFYAAAPLITSDGFHIGTFSIADYQHREFSASEVRMLASFARTAMDQVDLRYTAIENVQEMASTNTNLANMQQRLLDLNSELEATNEQLTLSNSKLYKSYDTTLLLNKNLKRSEQRLKSFITKAPIAFAILTGREMTIEVANDMVLKIWGKTTAVIGKPLAIALPELHDQPYLGILDNVFMRGETYIGDTAPVLFDYEGVISQHYFDFIYEPVKGEDGNTESIIVIANEVTERILQKEHLEGLNQQLEIALKAGELGTYHLDIQTWKNNASSTCKSHFGLPPAEDFAFKDFIHAIVPEHREAVEQKVQEAIAKNITYQAEYLTRWPDGSLHWINSSGLTRYDAEGKPLDLIGVTVDVTKRKNYEAQKEDFLSIASHELKTPITSLRGTIQMLEMLKHKSADATISKLIDMSGVSIKKITALVDDLLNMHRISLGQLKLNRIPISAAKLINSCFQDINIIGKHQLNLVGDLDALINADEQRIEQVISNLINNAIKYGPESYKIDVRIENNADCIKIHVRDYGEGIAPELQHQIFERYYRVYPDGKKYSGLGLGLYISAEIVRRHGGEIGVDSTPGEGSDFWFTIPHGF
ncbi:ATP-binding protein [Sphingobacterium zeae]|uniref:histidine kinase n=1 Tax=Sphingobacterium zeae TaxID=1776859 RepID=A0ABU0U616_9SPHI|nr:ATP-binding protein [Sphingobacterium zeae]MDQ1150385.1 signal transduction histidine kinase [Sphingobacterium zeae]